MDARQEAPGGALVSRGAQALACGLLALGLLASVPVTFAEVANWRIEVLAKTGLAARWTEPSAAMAWWERTCGVLCGSRGLVASAALRNDVVARQSDRRALLLEARKDLDAVIATEPGNGDAWIQRAYNQALTDGDISDAAVADLTHSYEIQPFSRRSGVWRLRFAGLAWPKASPDLRRRAFAEADWLLEIDPSTKADVSAAMALAGATQVRSGQAPTGQSAAP